MSFNFEITVKPEVNLTEETVLMEFINLYVDFKNYTANQIGWGEVRQSLINARQFLKNNGVLVNAVDDQLEQPITFDEV